MNKITTTLIGMALFLSTLLTGTSAFAADIPTDCAGYGSRTNIPAFATDFNRELDQDRDGIICESKGSTVTSVPSGTSTLGPANPDSTAPGASGTTGNGGEHSSGANENSQNSQSNNGKLANTGWEANVAGVAAILLLLGGVFLFFNRRRTT